MQTSKSLIDFHPEIRFRLVLNQEAFFSLWNNMGQNKTYSKSKWLWSDFPTLPLWNFDMEPFPFEPRWRNLCSRISCHLLRQHNHSTSQSLEAGHSSESHINGFEALFLKTSQRVTPHHHHQLGSLGYLYRVKWANENLSFPGILVRDLMRYCFLLMRLIVLGFRSRGRVCRC